MVMCKKCGFSVSELMKFALMNNSCPSCGASLFSEEDTSFLNLLRSKISAEKFAKKLTEEQVYDISLFIFNEMEMELIPLYNHHKSLSVEADDLEYHEEELSEKELIKREVESEFLDSNLLLDDDGEVIDEHIDEKVQRLKKIHEQKLKTNPNLGKELPTTRPGKKTSGFKVNRLT